MTRITFGIEGEHWIGIGVDDRAPLGLMGSWWRLSTQGFAQG
jgi:hypothetical protein